MKNREWLRRLPMDLLMDIVGGLIYAVGLNCFANPNDIAPGGMSGVAVILNYLFEIPMGITIFCVNIPLLLLAWRFLGHEFTLHSSAVWRRVHRRCGGTGVPAGFHHRRDRYREPAAAAALALYAHRQDDDRGGRGDRGGFDGGL